VYRAGRARASRSRSRSRSVQGALHLRNEQLSEEEEPITGGCGRARSSPPSRSRSASSSWCPVALTSLIKDQLNSSVLFWLVEGAVRTAIFIGYLWALSHMQHLRRLFQYHGAEHKTIACYEAGDALVPERARLYSRLHPRCGTSFLLVVMVVAVFVFAPLGLPSWWLLVTSRILGVPLIAGISFELIKAAGRNRDRRWSRR
jgi:uncharacterized protein YqhQ